MVPTDQPDFTRRLVGVMFTDIVGYSTKASRDELESFHLIQEHNKLLTEIISSYKGEVVKTIGDAVMGRFQSVVRAVECALEIHSALDEFNTDKDESKQLKLRIGVHAGDVLETADSDLFGHDINIAARLEKLAEPGSVIVTDIVYTLIRGKTNFAFNMLGDFQLKNIPTPIRLYTVAYADVSVIQKSDQEEENSSEQRMIGHYKILEKLGAGGMGEVWLAEDTRLERKVALKFLPHHVAQEEGEKARFIQEAKAAARLTHNNIAQVYEIGEEEGRLFIVMEHVGGGSLRDKLDQAKGRSLQLDKVLSWIQEAAQGLTEAHKQGIIHRDIKPDNLMLTESGQIKITDFGLARLETATRLTISGATLGTVNYMSPEQVLGRDVDHRADLFSLGATMYELLTGRRVFDGDNANIIYHAILNNNPDPIDRFRTDSSSYLSHIVEKLLTKSVNLRYQSAKDLVADITRIKDVSIPFQKSFSGNFISRLKEMNRQSILVTLLLLFSLVILGIPKLKPILQLEYDLVASRTPLFLPSNFIQKASWRLNELKIMGDVDAYIASALLTLRNFGKRTINIESFNNAESDLNMALSIRPSDASLHNLYAIIRFRAFGLKDSLGQNAIYAAQELDNDNGAYSLLSFCTAYAANDTINAKYYLNEAFESKRFAFNESQYYSAVYRCLKNVNLLHPRWQFHLPYLVWWSLFDPLTSYIQNGPGGTLLPYGGVTGEASEADALSLLERGKTVESIGWRVMLDRTGSIGQFNSGPGDVNYGLSSQFYALQSLGLPTTQVEQQQSLVRELESLVRFRDHVSSDQFKRLFFVCCVLGSVLIYGIMLLVLTGIIYAALLSNNIGYLGFDNNVLFRKINFEILAIVLFCICFGIFTHFIIMLIPFNYQTNIFALSVLTAFIISLPNIGPLNKPIIYNIRKYYVVALVVVIIIAIIYHTMMSFRRPYESASIIIVFLMLCGLFSALWINSVSDNQSVLHILLKRGFIMSSILIIGSSLSAIFILYAFQNEIVVMTTTSHPSFLNMTELPQYLYFVLPR